MDPALALPLSCPECAAQMPETAAFCPGCGRSMAVPEKAPGEPQDSGHSNAQEIARGKIGILPENIAGALAYFTFIPAALFLILEPFKKNRYVRFHSVQCLLLWVAALATAATLRLLGIALFFVPIAGPLVAMLLSVMAGLAGFLLWLVLVVKALQGEMFKLPVLGDFSEQKAGSS